MGMKQLASISYNLWIQLAAAGGCQVLLFGHWLQQQASTALPGPQTCHYPLTLASSKLLLLPLQLETKIAVALALQACI
jgi:hypothetical protein